MSAAAAGLGRVGRPPGPDQETLAKGRQYLELTTKYDVPVTTIAERDGVTSSWVWELMKKARTAATEHVSGGTAGEAGAAPSAAGQNQPAPKSRKMAAGTLLHRAWRAMRDVRGFELLGAEGREFWVNALMEIRGASDDGVTLGFSYGGLYNSRLEFLSVFGRTPADLEQLFSRGLLVELEDGGVAMPYRFGLRREAIAGSARGAGKALDPRQAYMMHLVPAACSDSTEIPISLESDSTETPISVESDDLPRTVDVIVKENQTLDYNHSKRGRSVGTVAFFSCSGSAWSAF